MQDKQQWLLERQTGIGGSDAAAAVGLSPWKTPLQLWMEKTGQVAADFVPNEAMRWGTKQEPLVREEYEEITGRQVSQPGLLRSQRWPFAIANVDGITDDGRVLEIKTARSSKGWGDPPDGMIPDHYMLQVQHYLAVTELEIADVAVLLGGQELRIYEVPRDDEIIVHLMAKEAEFWRYVEEGIEPPPTTYEDAARLWPQSLARKVEADESLAALLQDYEQLLQQQKDLAAQADRLKAKICEYMGDADTLILDGRVVATWKTTKPTQRLDTARLKKEEPEVWTQYVKECEGIEGFFLRG